MIRRMRRRLNKNGVPIDNELVSDPDSTPLLAYALTSQPNPILASSTAGPVEHASLDIIASNQTNSIIQITSITLSLIIGKFSKDFTTVTEGIAAGATTNWLFSQQGGSFTFTPKTADDGKVGPGGLNFSLGNIQVNDQLGISHLNVTEVALVDGADHSGGGYLKLAKFPITFHLGQLQVAPSSIGSGGSTTLDWSGSPATYMIQYGAITITHPKGEPNQPLPDAGSYQVTDLIADTVFTLTATVDLNGTSVPVQRQAQVTVERPTILDFNATPVAVGEPGSTVTLTWQTQNATSCKLYSSNATAPLNVPTESDGFEVSPILATTYTLRAFGEEGDQPDSQTATVSSQFTPEWRLVPQVPPWLGLSTPVAVEFNDELVVVGQFNAIVYSSKDGATWTTLSDGAPWPGRNSGAVLAFDNKLWVMGGLGQSGNAAGDVWSSADGATWTQEPDAPWGARQGHGALSFDDKMWIFGGNRAVLSQPLNDVWWSSDGTTWTEATAAAAWPARTFMSNVVYDDKMWVLGGAGKRASPETRPCGPSEADAWWSTDGATWTAGSQPPWQARLFAQAAALNDQLYIMGGSSSILEQITDMWSMNAGGSWTELVPKIPVENVINVGQTTVPWAVAYWNSIWLVGGQVPGPSANERTVYQYVPTPPYPEPLT